MLAIIGVVLLWLLRIIGLILALILFVILSFLFVPFKYRAEGHFHEAMDVSVKFSWFFSLINGVYEYKPESSAYKVRLLWFAVVPSKPKKEKVKKKVASDVVSEILVDELVVDQEDLKDDQQSKMNIDSSKDKSVKNLTKKSDEESVKESVKESDEESVKETEKKSDNESGKKPDKKANKKAKKSSKKGSNRDSNKQSPLEPLKQMWDFLQQEENEGVLKHITKYIFKILHWILPRRAAVELEFGLEDPSITGYLAGIASIVYVLSKRKIHIVPNFNESKVQGDFKIKGRLFIFQLLYYIIRIIIDKRVRRLIKKVRS